MIILSEWYYHSGIGYLTRRLIINSSEISDMHESYDPYHNMDGTVVYMKNGNQYNVKEKINDIMEMIEREA